MAKVCEIVDETTKGCLQWTDFSLVPELTASDRNELIVWAVGIFAVVFVVRQIMRFF